VLFLDGRHVSERSQFVFTCHAFVLLEGTPNAIFELPIPFWQLRRHDTSAARCRSPRRRTILDYLTEMELVHQSNRSFVGITGFSFQFGRTSTRRPPHLEYYPVDLPQT
jgi:hypothetical protein